MDVSKDLPASSYKPARVLKGEDQTASVDKMHKDSTFSFDEKGSVTPKSIDAEKLKMQLEKVQTYSLEVNGDTLPPDIQKQEDDSWAKVVFQTAEKSEKPQFFDSPELVISDKAKLTQTPSEGKLIRTDKGKSILEFEVNGSKVYVPLSKSTVTMVKDLNSKKIYYVDLTKDGEVNVHEESVDDSKWKTKWADKEKSKFKE